MRVYGGVAIVSSSKPHSTSIRDSLLKAELHREKIPPDLCLMHLGAVSLAFLENRPPHFSQSALST